MPVLDFPASPLTGDKYPVPAVAGQPQYTYDGVKWTTVGAQISNATPATALPLMDQTVGLVGTAAKYAREDHVHPTDTSLLAKSANLADVADVTASRKSIYAAPFDAMAYNGMQINGSMEVSQELGNSGTGTNGKYICDGWSLGLAGTSAVSAIQTFPNQLFPSFTSFINVSVSTAQPSLGANDYVGITSVIEGYRISRLAWGVAQAQPITIGFWTCHHRTGIYSVSIRNSAATRSYVTTYTQNAADTVEYKTITIPGCVDGAWNINNQGGMILSFQIACGSTLTTSSPNTWLASNVTSASGQVNAAAATTDVFRITGVVVLPGIEAPSAARSPLIMRPYDQELLTCKRYFMSYGGVSGYEKVGSASGLSAVTASICIPLAVSLRASPTISTSAGSDWMLAGSSTIISTGISLEFCTANVLSLFVSAAAGVVAGNSYVLQSNNTTSARLKVDARL